MVLWDKHNYPTPPLRIPKPAAKVVFSTVGEAKAALSGDRLGTLRRGVRTVFVCTSVGSGEFSAKVWDEWDKVGAERGQGAGPGGPGSPE